MTTLEAGKRIALKNILFATDFSSSANRALPFALAFTHQYGARLYGAHVLSASGYLFMEPETWPAFIQEEEHLQQEAATHLEEQLRGVPHQVLCGVGNVSDVLCSLIAEHDIDLIVVGTHGRTGARKLLMGSVAEKIFRQATCPVLSVGPNVSDKPIDKIRFQNILFATDFGEPSSHALPYAISLAEKDQSRLALLHVVEQPPARILNLEEVKSSLMRRLKELAPPESEPECHVECLVEFSSQYAPPAERILEVARNRGTDLIVLGVRPTHGAVSVVTHLAPTTAQCVVAHALCPVLTVRG